MVGILIILLLGKVSPQIPIMFRQVGESDDGDHPDSGQDAAGRLSGWGRQARQHSHAEGEEEEVCLWQLGNEVMRNYEILPFSTQFLSTLLLSSVIWHFVSIITRIYIYMLTLSFDLLEK